MKIEIEPYNENWKDQFKIICAELKEILAPINPQIDHIGSTSITGLSAKPIIDILIGVEKEIHLDNSVVLLSNNEYIF